MHHIFNQKASLPDRDLSGYSSAVVLSLPQLGSIMCCTVGKHFSNLLHLLFSRNGLAFLLAHLLKSEEQQPTMRTGGFIFLMPMTMMCDCTLIAAALQDISASSRQSFPLREHRMTCSGAGQRHVAAREVKDSAIFTVNCAHKSRF